MLHYMAFTVYGDIIVGHRDRTPERETEVTPATPLTSSPLSPPAVVDVDSITQRLAVLQKRLDIEMKVSEFNSIQY